MCRAIYQAIEPFIGICANAYIDDVTVYSDSVDNHITHLKKVLERFCEVNMKLNFNKCHLFEDRINLLGFSVFANGITPLPDKTDKIFKFPRPANETGIRAFVNLAGFYRRHVNNLSQIVTPLNDLLKKKNPFVWSDVCEKAFQELKGAIITAATLSFPDRTKVFHVYTDASDYALGVTMSQIDKQGVDTPICLLSRRLQGAELRYNILEKELLAIIFALLKLGNYLYDKPFFLYTDNAPITYLFKKNEPNQRLQRWILALQEFSFTTVHISGKLNVVADALSAFLLLISNQMTMANHL